MALKLDILFEKYAKSPPKSDKWNNFPFSMRSRFKFTVTEVVYQWNAWTTGDSLCFLINMIVAIIQLIGLQ